MNANEAIPEDLLSVQQVAAELRLSNQRVRQLIASSQIAATQVGRSWVVTRAAMEDARSITTTAVLAPKRQQPKQSPMRALSFFSGAMGLDMGLEAEGINTILACESDRWARKTIATNRPDIPILGDIWKYSAAEIMGIAGIQAAGEIDVIAGGPPCQAFSTAGARRGFDDNRGNVFLHFLELIRHIQPKYAVIENVRGLLSMPVSPAQVAMLNLPNAEQYTTKHGAIRLVADQLNRSGYQVSFNLYNSANFGTPQIRERVVILATRADSPVPYLSPTHSENPDANLKPWVTFAEAQDGLNAAHATYVPYPEKRLQYFRLLQPGQYWKHLPADLQPHALGKAYYLGGGKTGFYRRIAWDRPAPTLVTHPAMPATDLCHPELDRPLSIEEYKRVQEFPDDWQIEGPIQQQYKQIGNAVPCSLARAIGRTLQAHSEGRTLPQPRNFKYSRYKCTSDHDILDTQHGIIAVA